ncbi:hypothetical protein J8L86_17595 [Shewanella sp. MMG014]|uniref:hypothetical protein n=1 Tax=Shewanella sp. MMG014 TaxID=2822691 RepID=UPI001B385483|nr:hypothetical protein [Shewanella sp. MMG014]MBQ4891665.1 hypothetical protein [Shewanella sp. MMG014]
MIALYQRDIKNGKGWGILGDQYPHDQIKEHKQKQKEYGDKNKARMEKALAAAKRNNKPHPTANLTKEIEAAELALSVAVKALESEEKRLAAIDSTESGDVANEYTELSGKFNSTFAEYMSCYETSLTDRNIIIVD